MVLSRKERQAMEISVQWLDPVPAPIRIGDQIGTLVISLPDEVIKLPLRAAKDVNTLGLFNRIAAAVKYLIFGATTPANDCSIKICRCAGCSLRLKAVRVAGKQRKYRYS